MLIHLKTKLKIVNLIIYILQNSAKRFDGLTGEQSSKPVINYTGPILERNKREKRVERLATKYHSHLNGLQNKNSSDSLSTRSRIISLLSSPLQHLAGR